MNLHSQTDSVYKFTLPQVKLTHPEKNKIVTYEFENERNLFLMNDSFLTANPDKYNYSVRISDIKKISVRDGSYAWRTSVVVAAVGGGLGLLTGTAFAIIFAGIHDASLVVAIPLFTLSGALAGGILGAILGVGVPYYHNYNFIEKDLISKRETVRKILKNHYTK